MTDNEGFHPACLRDNPPASVPGTVLFTLRTSIAARGPSPDHLTIVLAGELMFAEASSDCVRQLLARHLCGPATGSILRQGVCWLIGIDAAISGSADEVAINRWIDESLVVFLRPNLVAPVSSGWFNTIGYHGGGTAW